MIDVDPNSTTYSSEITAIVINQSAPRGGFALSPDGSLLYTADFGHGPSFAGLYVSVIDTRTNTALLTLPVDTTASEGLEALALAVSLDGNLIYVTLPSDDTVRDSTRAFV